MIYRKIPKFFTIRLISENYIEDGLDSGVAGVIVDQHSDNAYEVDFSDGDEVTIAVLAVQYQDIEVLHLRE